LAGSVAPYVRRDHHGYRFPDPSGALVVE
jgi:hypothetical protein